MSIHISKRDSWGQGLWILTTRSICSQVITWSNAESMTIEPQRTHFSKFQSKLVNFLSWKCIWKWLLQMVTYLLRPQYDNTVVVVTKSRLHKSDVSGYWRFLWKSISDLISTYQVVLSAWRLCCYPNQTEDISVIRLQRTLTKYREKLNTVRLRQNGRHFPDDIFKCIFLNENV